ncbi:glycosyltransferase [Roseibacillus ishigakijimensis]|uniref:Glycosyltransferase n=1 Tax=Roseibacillus ishigakijimensis TaxID=454146 RepID=A0A934RL25_9BACT|nr:glycosyltransferase [Roseibacillus ishigakijimensis]MBK1833677.1 glycosyltransferase [Roseibacillus ishigakijimensis]
MSGKGLCVGDRMGEDEPMRLLQIMLARGNGGAEAFFERLALAFARQGVSQRLVIAENPARAERLRAGGGEVVTVPANGWRKFLVHRAVQAQADRFQPTHALAWMNRAAGAMPTGNFVKMARLGGCYKLKYYQRCEHLVANTPGIVEYLVGAGWPEEAVSLISNFGERAGAEARSLREELGLAAEVPVLLSPGRFHEVKAQEVAIRALAQIPEAVLLLAGEGERRAFYEEVAAEAGVSERVRFLGWRDDMANLYATADLCVFPSRYEPLGNVVLEAWVSGTPIVAAKSDGPSWLIEEGVNGRLFEIDDSAQLAEQVNELLADPTQREALAKAGREKWLAAFSEEKIVAQYLALFEKLAAQSASKSS